MTILRLSFIPQQWQEPLRLERKSLYLVIYLPNLDAESDLKTDSNILASWRERQEALSAVWGFQCTCQHCSSTAPEIEASDKRLERILELQTILADFDPGSVGTTAMAEELIRLYEEEHLDAAKATGHKVAALAYNAVGDVKNARRHAEIALEVGIVSSGSDEYAEEMKTLLRNPVAHWTYRVRGHNEL